MLGGVSMMFEWFSSDFCFILVGFCKLVLVRLQNFGVIYNRLPWRGMHQIHAWPGHYLESSSALGNQLSIFLGYDMHKRPISNLQHAVSWQKPFCRISYSVSFHSSVALSFFWSAFVVFLILSSFFFIFNLMPRVQPFFWVVHVGFPLLHSSHFIYLLFIHVFIVLSFFLRSIRTIQQWVRNLSRWITLF